MAKQLESAGEVYGDNVIHLATYQEFLNGMKSLTERRYQTKDPTLCGRALQKLIHRIEIKEGGFRVRYLVGEQHVKREMQCEGHTNPIDLIHEKKVVGSDSNRFVRIDT